MSSWSEKGRDALKRIQWLMEQVLAKEFPITEEQIDRFGKNPDVILPPNAVESYRVPDEFKRIRNLILASDNSLVFTAVRGQSHVIVGKNFVYKIESESFEWNFPIDAISGKPLLFGTDKFLNSDLDILEDWDLLSHWKLKLGDETLIEMRGVTVYFRDTDGSIWYTVRVKQKGVHQTWRYADGKSELMMDGDIRPFTRLHRFVGGVYGFWEEPTNPEGKLWCGRVAEIEERLVPACPEMMTFVKLKNNRDFYVHSARHHQQRVVVIDGKAEPAFNWVSPPFEHPVHGECYLGVVDHHVITMKIL